MIEIRIHGRGGQGSVTMAELLAEAAFYGKKEAQAFPSFGVERRGAPVTAFVRIDDKSIRLRSQIYNPDYIIVLDPTLLADEDTLAGIKKDSVLLVNSSKPLDFSTCPKGVRVQAFNATGIALETLGRPIINTIMLGAFASLSGLIELSATSEAIKKRFSGEMQEKNLVAVKRGYEVISNN